MYNEEVELSSVKYKDTTYQNSQLEFLQPSQSFIDFRQKLIIRRFSTKSLTTYKALDSTQSDHGLVPNDVF